MLYLRKGCHGCQLDVDFAVDAIHTGDELRRTQAVLVAEVLWLEFVVLKDGMVLGLAAYDQDGHLRVHQVLLMKE